MRILVYPNELSIGGSQINGIDLAAAASAAGHEVVVYAPPGPLVTYIEEVGLRYIPGAHGQYRPGPARVAQLASIARKEKLDLVHAYEWSPCLEAELGAGLSAGVPVLGTVLSMSVPEYIPKSMPVIMGTVELQHAARDRQRADVWVLEPPINVTRDHPGLGTDGFREEHGVADSELLVVSVSRLSISLKLDAVVRAIDAVDLLADRLPVRLVLVGDGEARPALAERSSRVNTRHGREVVTLAGSMLDPRSAYASADLVVGMGSSALRAMAIGCPVVVQGEMAFSEVFQPSTLELFLHQGFYGLADGEPGADRLAGQVEQLLNDPAQRTELGRYGREIVTERFSLERAAKIQLDIYDQVLQRPSTRRTTDSLAAAGRALGLEIENHDPRRKRRRAQMESDLLSAARRGVWPPDGYATWHLNSG